MLGQEESALVEQNNSILSCAPTSCRLLSHWRVRAERRSSLWGGDWDHGSFKLCDPCPGQRSLHISLHNLLSIGEIGKILFILKLREEDNSKRVSE
jgi:hypothetical protein